MLTREQKIDFLKCCIAAYENPTCHRQLWYNNHGFCDMYTIYRRVVLKSIGDGFVDWVDDLRKDFYVFYAFIENKKVPTFEYGMFFPFCKKGLLQRAQVARQFLKKEYGITVPKRKQLKAKKK